MRNIQLTTGLIILLVYFLVSLAGWISMRTIFAGDEKKLKMARWIYWSISILQSLLFFLLFIYPSNTTSTTRYSLYFIYNSILITDIFSKIPLSIAGFASLFLPKISRFRFMLSFSGTILSAGILLMFIWGFSAGPRTLLKSEVTLYYEDLPDSFDGLRITQISDLHLGNFHYKRMFRRAVRANNHFKPDILVFTGDLVNNFAYETEGWKDEFLEFKAPFKFAIAGNHDYGDYYRWPDKNLKEENYRGIKTAIDDFGFELLSNRSYAIVRKSDTIYVTGVENWGHPPFPQYADLGEALKDVPADAFKILLTHDPAHWDAEIKNKENFPLTLSGHSHGLQWGIKPAGIEFSLIYLSRITWAGIYENKGNYLYVNRGLGTIGIPMRIDMPAEITLFTLRKK
jgi:uncharacterized protein